MNKITWEYKVNGTKFTGDLDTQLLTIKKESYAGDILLEKYIDADARSYEVDLASYGCDLHITLYGKYGDSEVSEVLMYDASYDASNNLSLLVSGNYTDVPKGSKATFYFQVKRQISVSEAETFVPYNGILYLVDDSSNTETIVALFENQSVVGSYEATVTEDTDFHFRLYWNPGYTVEKTVTVTTADVSESEHTLKTQDSTAVYVDKGEDGVISYKLTYDGVEVVPDSVVVLAQYSYNYEYETLDSSLYMLDTANKKINIQDFTATNSTEHHSWTGAYKIVFSYNGLTATLPAKVIIRELAIEITNADECQNIAANSDGTYTPPVIKWKVTYAGNEVTDEVAFLITAKGIRGAFDSGYLVGDTTEDSWISMSPYKDADGNMCSVYSDGCTRNGTVLRELDTSLNIYSDGNVFDTPVYINCIYKNQEIIATVNIATTSDSTTTYNAVKYVPVSFQNIDNSLRLYFDDCLTEAFIDSVTVPTGGAGTFDLNYHWAYNGETNPTLVKQYITVTTPEGLVTNFSSDTSDGTMNVLSLDATNFVYPCSIEGDYTIQITLTLQADSSSAPLTVTATKTCTAIADDGKTFELTLDTANAENLKGALCPVYQLHCWYGNEEITNWTKEIKIRNAQWSCGTQGDYLEAERICVPTTAAGESVTFQADYQGKLATITHTPTWK